MCGISTGIDAGLVTMARWSAGRRAARPLMRVSVAARVLMTVLFWTVMMGPGAVHAFNLIPYYHLDGFSGRVVDVDTGEPIVGAAVLAVYHEGRNSIAGSSWVPVDGRETLTDERGEFNIPEMTEWFGEKSGHPRGRLMIFKPGYGILRHERAVAVGVNKSWPPPGRHVEYALPRLKTPEERDRNPIMLPLLPEVLWPEFKRLVNCERASQGFTPLPPSPNPYAPRVPR